MVGLETAIHEIFKQYNNFKQYIINCVYHSKVLGVLGPLFSAQYLAQCTELGGGGSMRFCSMGVPSSDRYLSHSVLLCVVKGGVQ